MGIGDLLGSISPAFGLISGKGLGSFLKYLNLPYDIYALASGGHHSPSPVDVAGQQPAQQVGGVPSLASQSASLPGMSNPSQSPFSMVGNALMQNKSQTPNVQVPQAYAPQQSPIGSDLLQQLLASIGQRG